MSLKKKYLIVVFLPAPNLEKGRLPLNATWMDIRQKGFGYGNTPTEKPGFGSATQASMNTMQIKWLQYKRQGVCTIFAGRGAWRNSMNEPKNASSIFSIVFILDGSYKPV